MTEPREGSDHRVPTDWAWADDAPTNVYPVEQTEQLYAGRVITLRRDRVRMPDGGSALRETVAHPGAVAVVALDDDDRVVLIRQYRHPVRRYLWELPAGLLDVAGEPLPAAAARELAEEVALAAGEWSVLLDLRTAPGFCDEAIRVFLARDLRPVPVADRHQGTAEESDLTVVRVPLEDAVAAVLDGTVLNAVAVAGILATAAVRARSGS